MEGNACSLCGWGNSTSNGHVAVIIAIDSDVAALRVENATVRGSASSGTVDVCNEIGAITCRDTFVVSLVGSVGPGVGGHCIKCGRRFYCSSRGGNAR